MIKCGRCGTDNPEGSIFCKGCGQKLSGIDNATLQSQKGGAQPIFCPNCGKKFSNGETFCDECGTSLIDSESGSTDKRASGSGKIVKVAAGIVVAVLIAVVVVFGGRKLLTILPFGSGSDTEETNYLVYFRDGEMMLADLNSSKKDPVMVTDSVRDRSGSDYLSAVAYKRFVTKDEKYVYYMEDYDGETFDLYRVALKKAGKSDAAVKIDSKVDRYSVLDNDNVLYVRNDSLCYYNGKESLKFSKRVNSFKTDDAEKTVYWSEVTDDGTYNWYCQDMSQKKDKIQLAKNAETFCAYSDFERMYALKEGKLLEIGKDGESETIDRNVTRIVGNGISRTGDSMYYLKADEVTIMAADVVYDNSGAISESQKQTLQNMEITMTVYTLCQYYNGGSTEIAENVASEAVSGNGDYCIYRVLPDLKSIRIPWSDISESASRYYDGTIQSLIQSQNVIMLAAGTKGGTYALGNEEEEGTSKINHYYDKDSNRLYYIITNEEDEEGVLYFAELSSSGATIGNVIAEVESDAQIVGVVGKDVYYMQDYSNYGADLYMNTEFIEEEVNALILVDDGTFIFNAENNKDGSFLLDYYNGKSSQDLEDYVSYAAVSTDGKVFYLVDYDSISNEGTLVYFDGKNSREIDSDVAMFSMPSSARVLSR